jgi:transposase-like protein
MTTKFTDISRFDENQAREHLEKLRWPNGVACPHCGDTEIYTLKGKATSKEPVRKGVYKCKGCRKQFTVTVGTLFEGSHIPLNKWLMTVSLMCSSKKGISSHQLHRMLEVTYKSAWFMSHRIRYAMQQPELKNKLVGIVEVDETYVGGKPRRSKRDRTNCLIPRRGRGTKKAPVVALVQRNGIVKSQTMESITGKNLKEFIRNNVDNTSEIMTDDFKAYKTLRKEFKHQSVNHSIGQYVRGNVHTNTIEGYFSLLKRGITGVFHHVSKKHLHRYLTEFDFRYNMRSIKDSDRTCAVIPGIEGKRLLYRDSSSVAQERIR